MKPLKILLAGLLLLRLTAPVSGQDTLPGEFDQLRKFQTLSDARYYNSLFEKTSIDSNDYRLIYSKLAYMAAVESHDPGQKALALLNMGIAYNHQYSYNQAMKSFLAAKGLADSLKSEELNGSVYHHMGILYLDMRNNQLAEEFLRKAYEVRKDFDNRKALAESLNGMALVSWLNGELDTALVYLFRTLEIWQEQSSADGIARAYNNIGIVYNEKHDYETSYSFLLKSLALNTERNDKWSLAENCNNLGEVKIGMKDYASAGKYLARARDYATPIKAYLLLADNFRYMARLYQRTGQYERAFEYSEKFHNLDDSLFNRKTYSIISDLTSLFELEKKEQSILIQKQQIELLEQKRKNDTLQKAVLASMIMFTLIIALVIINRQKRINHRNRLLIEKDLQIQEASQLLLDKEASEKIRLMNELEQNNKFLIDFALYIGMKNEFLIGLRQQLKALINQNISPDTIRNIIFQVNQNLRINKELIELQENVEKVNFRFIQTLTEKFPGLTEHEKNLAILLRLNFSSKEIADLKAVSVKAVEMSRYRLKKKIQLGDHESLSHFIKTL